MCIITFIPGIQEDTISLYPSQQWYFTSCRSEMVFLSWCEMFSHYRYGENVLHCCSNLHFFDCEIWHIWICLLLLVFPPLWSHFSYPVHTFLGWLIDLFFLLTQECVKMSWILIKATLGTPLTLWSPGTSPPGGVQCTTVSRQFFIFCL